MKKITGIICMLLLLAGTSFGQGSFSKLDFLMGNWSGTGSGFGNNQSKIESGFQFVMGGKYIEVRNESWFEPTKTNPKGEHHVDKGFISYDKSRKQIVYRQFNNEGYVNQYVLTDSLSNDSTLVFQTENIENFVPGGKAQWIIRRLSTSRIQTVFNVSFPGKPYACFGTNDLKRKNGK